MNYVSFFDFVNLPLAEISKPEYTKAWNTFFMGWKIKRGGEIVITPANSFGGIKLDPETTMKDYLSPTDYSRYSQFYENILKENLKKIKALEELSNSEILQHIQLLLKKEDVIKTLDYFKELEIFIDLRHTNFSNFLSDLEKDLMEIVVEVKEPVISEFKKPEGLD